MRPVDRPVLTDDQFVVAQADQALSEMIDIGDAITRLNDWTISASLGRSQYSLGDPCRMALDALTRSTIAGSTADTLVCVPC
jgi:hypothetical protein